MSATTAHPNDLLPMNLTVRIVGTVGVIALVLGGAWLYSNGWGWQAFLDWKRSIGVIPFFTGLALLPLIGIPTSPLFLLAGVTFGLTAALAGSAISIAVNLVLSFWLARKVLKQSLVSWLQRRDYQLPQLQAGKALSFLVLMRLAPGLPAFLKNYATALVDVPFGIYLVISWVITFCYAAGLIILGDSLYSGNITEGAIAIVLLVCVGVGFAWLHKRQQRVFSSDSDDMLLALRKKMQATGEPLSYQALTLRMLKMISVLLLLWGIVAQNAGWTFAAEAIIAAVLSSMFFAMMLPTHYSFTGLLLFASYFIVEALRGGVDVAWRAARPDLPISPGWIHYPLTLPPGSAQVLFLNSASLLPGTLSVSLKAEENIAVMHILTAGDSVKTELARLEYWVMRVFVAPGESP